MIARFNFFDIYAYFLPGAALVGLLWLPFGIVLGHWPINLPSALLFLITAYIIGFALYYPASRALPTESIVKCKTENGRWKNLSRHPSDYILDVKDSRFPRSFKEGLQELINSWFKGHVTINIDPKKEKVVDRESESQQRNLAFFLCRSTLMTAKVASYGEQFQGLYELARNLAVVFALACAYHLGWALAARSIPSTQHRDLVFVLAAIAILCAAILDGWGSKKTEPVVKKRTARAVIGFLVLALFLCPFLLLRSKELPTTYAAPSEELLLIAVAVEAFIAWRCFSAYKPFAHEFAKTIYRDFYAYAMNQENKAGGEGD